MRRLEPEDRYGELTKALRCALREEYADAGEYEMREALDSMLDTMSPAEAFNFGSALSGIAQDAGKVLADPMFKSVARTALPLAGQAVGTLYGGPVGTALGGQLGTLAAGALTGAAPPPAAARPASPVAAGSQAAKQALILTRQKDVPAALLATALGTQGRRDVSGIPNAQLLGGLSRLFAQAAADADELMYLEQSAESAGEAEASDTLYGDLLGADDIELSEAAWEGLY